MIILGSGLLMKYDNSPSKLIRSYFPDHNWDTSLFNTLPRGHWDNPDNISVIIMAINDIFNMSKKFIKKLSIKMSIRSIDDWYRITGDDIKELRGIRRVNIYNPFHRKWFIEEICEFAFEVNNFDISSS